MDDVVIVIMLKDEKTGFLEKELGSYTLEENSELIFQIYGEGGEGNRAVVLRLSCDREVADWEYDAIFDYYDTEVLLKLARDVEEEEGHLNPVWVIRFPFTDSYEEMEAKLSELLETHKNELLSVYEAIADKEDDYSEE